MMDKTIRYLYLQMYSKGPIEYSRLFLHPDASVFIRSYAAFGSTLYFKSLEAKSKEARDEWGRHTVYHTRNIKDVKRKK